jgi:mono/diheme cytochrome c family protein
VRRALLILAGSIALIGLLTGGLAWLLTDPRPPTGAGRAQRLYYVYCVQCHGVDGKGSWRASLFLLRPGDLADPRVADQPEHYLRDIVKNGGATIGRPGMPAFGAQLSDEDIALLVQYIRRLPTARQGRGSGSSHTRTISSPC